jgi:hypothetical protein
MKFQCVAHMGIVVNLLGGVSRGKNKDSGPYLSGATTTTTITTTITTTTYRRRPRVGAAANPEFSNGCSEAKASEQGFA